jgi:hypothetical protein
MKSCCAWKSLESLRWQTCRDLWLQTWCHHLTCNIRARGDGLETWYNNRKVWVKKHNAAFLLRVVDRSWKWRRVNLPGCNGRITWINHGICFCKEKRGKRCKQIGDHIESTPARVGIIFAAAAPLTGILYFAILTLLDSFLALSARKKTVLNI